MGHPRIRTDWEAIKLMVVGGVSFKDAEERTGVGWETIRKRAQREAWPYPAAVENKAKEMKARASEPLPLSVPSVPRGVREADITEIVADSWLERGEKHRLLAFNLAHGALHRAKAPKIKGWRDLETADKVARRAAGLDSTEGATVNVGLTLVNQRLSQVTEPVTLDLE